MLVGIAPLALIIDTSSDREALLTFLVSEIGLLSMGTSGYVVGT